MKTTLYESMMTIFYEVRMINTIDYTVGTKIKINIINF